MGKHWCRKKLFQSFIWKNEDEALKINRIQQISYFNGIQKMEKKPGFKDNLYVLAYPIKYKEQSLRSQLTFGLIAIALALPIIIMK